jgi:ParB family chromosome partitioning protein
MNIQNIPLSKLVPSPDNVRKTDRLSGIEQLAASIAVHGLLQNLQAKPASKGAFEVVAGSRRLAALKLMAKQKKIEADHLVPCNVLDGGDTVEISLAENEIRQAMHPADQFDAFKALADQKMSDEDIAARFGVSVAVVRQRLKLARVSPKLIALYRKGEMPLDCLMAFAISDDHKQQEKIWKDLPEWDKKDADAIRDTLTEAHIEADSKLARFVSVAAYEAAGGSVLRDLFDADSAGWITDPALLNRLASEKLEREAETTRAQGWKWVEIMPDLAWDTLRQFDRIQPTPTAQQQEEIEKLQAERDKIDDEDSEQEAEIFAKLEQLEGEIEFTAEEKARSGAIISIAHDGTLEIETGLVRPEDRVTAKKKATKGDADIDNAPPCFSSKLIEDLTAHRTAGLQAMLADNPKTALAAVVHRLALGVFYHGDGESCLEITPRVVYLDRSAEGIADAAAMKDLNASTKAMRKRLPKQGEKLWAWIVKQDQKTLLALLAVCAAHTVDTVVKNGNGSGGEHAGQLASALKLDMADYWQPAAASYFSRVSKEQTLAAIEEAFGASAKAGYVTLKKAALADAAEAKLKGLRWLPELLRAA